jgi:hypothetical protein
MTNSEWQLGGQATSTWRKKEVPFSGYSEVTLVLHAL